MGLNSGAQRKLGLLGKIWAFDLINGPDLIREGESTVLGRRCTLTRAPAHTESMWLYKYSKSPKFSHFLNLLLSLPIISL